MHCLIVPQRMCLISFHLLALSNHRGNHKNKKPTLLIVKILSGISLCHHKRKLMNSSVFNLLKRESLFNIDFPLYYYSVAIEALIEGEPVTIVPYQRISENDDDNKDNQKEWRQRWKRFYSETHQSVPCGFEGSPVFVLL
jgi:hypothetical protein